MGASIVDPLPPRSEMFSAQRALMLQELQSAGSINGTAPSCSDQQTNCRLSTCRITTQDHRLSSRFLGYDTITPTPSPPGALALGSASRTLPVVLIYSFLPF